MDRTDRLAVIRPMVDRVIDGAAGTLGPVVAATYPLEQVPEALRSLASGEVAGKIVVTV